MAIADKIQELDAIAKLQLMCVQYHIAHLRVQPERFGFQTTSSIHELGRDDFVVLCLCEQQFPLRDSSMHPCRSQLRRTNISKPFEKRCRGKGSTVIQIRDEVQRSDACSGVRDSKLSNG